MRSSDEIMSLVTKLRKQKKMTSTELAEQVGIAKSAMSRYENRNRQFPVNKVSAFARALGTSPEYLLGFEKEPIPSTLKQITDTSAKLNESRQKKVLKCAEDELKEQEKAKEKISSTIHDEIKQTTDNIIHIPKTKADEKIKPVKYYGAVSAGTGEFLFGVEIAETVYLPEIKLPTTPFDYALRINGDSMEPTFKHRQYIFVQSFSEGGDIRDGMLAIVLYESQVFFKKLCIENECVRLVSLNKKYPDIHVTNPDGFKVLGKVVV